MDSAFTAVRADEARRMTMAARRWMLGTASVAMLGMALCQPAYAQDNAAEAPAATEEATPQVTTEAPAAAAQEIIVTGSRIVRRDFNAPSPIVTVDQTLFEKSSTAAIEQNLNKLPQFTPAQTPTQGGDIQSTSTNTPGAATVSLRGIGVNRNLVLLDGRRATPANANMVVDINTIPAAAIERVEIITGGASATYGADAVGGVVNFILRKDFQGLDLDTQMGVTERGDAREFRVSAFTGANFDDGRGNVVVGFDYADRNGSKRIDRKWFRDYWKNPNTNGTEFFSDFPHYVPSLANAPSQAVVNGIFAGRANPAADYPTTGNFYFNPSGTAFGGFDGLTIPGAYRFEQPVGGTKWEQLTTGQLAQNWQDELATFPLDRWTIYARSNYEFSDNISLFTQGYFNRSHSETIQQPSPAVNGWAAFIPNDGRALPIELQTLLDSRQVVVTPAVGTPGTAGYVPAVLGPVGSGADQPWQLNNYLNYANRVSTTDTFTYQVLAGLQGKIPSLDWTWEVYGSHGQARTDGNMTGFASLERYRTIISAPNWGAGFSSQGNAAFGGFGASTATCTSGLNPFANIAISQDCIEAISADIKTRSDMEQSVWEANLQGGLFTLPGGEVRFALGADYRRNRYEFLNDTLTTQGRSFLDQAIGLYPSGNSRGSINVKEVYGEMLVPILGDLPFVKRLELELGARYSDYNTTGDSFTYKILGDWEVTDWLRFRGGFNRAERAPNIAELFQARQQTFGAATGGDLCSANNPLPYSAGTGNTTNRAAVRQLCETLMNASGDAGTAANFYANPANQTTGASFVFISSEGNANLKPETAKTWTAGLVLQSPFESAWTRRLRLSVDYYNIQVDDAIGLQTGDIIQRQCFDTAFNPTLSASSPYCTGITRNVGIGTIGDLLGTYLNSGRFRTAGIDAQFDWGLDFADAGIGVPGAINLNVVVNYLDSMKSSVLPVLPLVDYAGTMGPTNENGLSSGSYRWKSFTSLTYAVGPATLTMQWQHLPKIKSVTAAADPDTTFVGAPAYNLFNLSASYAVTDDIVFRFGVENLFDKAPPIYEYTTAPPAGTVAGGQIAGTGVQGSYYDVLGRRFYIGAKAKF